MSEQTTNLFNPDAMAAADARVQAFDVIKRAVDNGRIDVPKGYAVCVELRRLKADGVTLDEDEIFHCLARERTTRAKLAAAVKRLEEIRQKAHDGVGEGALLLIEVWAEAALRAAERENGKA